MFHFVKRKLNEAEKLCKRGDINISKLFLQPFFRLEVGRCVEKGRDKETNLLIAPRYGNGREQSVPVWRETIWTFIMANLSFQNSLQLYLWTLMYKLPALLQRSSLACVGRQETGYFADESCRLCHFLRDHFKKRPTNLHM